MPLCKKGLHTLLLCDLFFSTQTLFVCVTQKKSHTKEECLSCTKWAYTLFFCITLFFQLRHSSFVWPFLQRAVLYISRACWRGEKKVHTFFYSTNMSTLWLFCTFREPSQKKKRVTKWISTDTLFFCVTLFFWFEKKWISSTLKKVNIIFPHMSTLWLFSLLQETEKKLIKEEGQVDNHSRSASEIDASARPVFFGSVHFESLISKKKCHTWARECYVIGTGWWRASNLHTQAGLVKGNDWREMTGLVKGNVAGEGKWPATP